MVHAKWQYFFGLLFVLVLLGFAEPACAENDYPSPPYHEYEKICRDTRNNMEVTECLLDRLSETERNLEKVVSLLAEWLGSNPESREEKHLLLRA